MLCLTYPIHRAVPMISADIMVAKTSSRMMSSREGIVRLTRPTLHEGAARCLTWIKHGRDQ